MGQTESQVAGGGTGTAYNPDADTDQLRSEIRNTRSEMDQTLEALGERLHPRHLLDDVLDWFRSGDKSNTEAARKLGTRVFDSLKENPVPTALIGAGLAWLMVDQRSSKTYQPHLHPLGPYDDDAPYDDGLRQHAGSLVDARTGQPYDDSYGADWKREQARSQGSNQIAHSGGNTGQQRGQSSQSVGDGGPGMIAKAKDMLSSAAGSVSESVSGAANSMTGAVSGGADRLRQSAQQLGGQGRSAMHTTASNLRGMGSTAGQRSQQSYFATRDALWQVAEDCPLAVGAAAMGLGLVLGLVVPRTRAEDEMMGEISDELLQQGKAAGQDLLERGKDVAQSTMAAAQGQVEEAGLSKEDLVSKVSAVASDVAGAAQKSMKEQGLAPSAVKEKAAQIATEVASTAKEETKQQTQDLKR